ncbi:PLP-dependent aminotransferase family protein [Leucobacter sp. wl10]|uniref:aminotransferase-like domain-containing protein n=1 Tax=Leucobacter sp. wl10 TaxID=2304677 RepID=UPI0013C2DA01|nr:PLP-dependent aminotransferase family protein [Leucobacter sp. wl10]
MSCDTSEVRVRDPSPWSPRLSDLPGPLHERLARGLSEDIDAGVVDAGARLPAHRDLAARLGLATGTVTKAYARLEHRGLVHAVRGRGTFVSGAERRAPIPEIIDLSVNAPPPQVGARLLADTLADLSRTLDPVAFASYPDPAGVPHHRSAISSWLREQGLDAPAERVLLTHGAQHALAVAFAAVAGPGGAVFTESCTYPGALTAARQAGHALVPVATDSRGMIPAALEVSLRRRGGGPRIVYVTPTLHNPTGATMDARRRREIVGVCRKHDAAIVEDDVYSLFRQPSTAPLAQLAPERTFYVNGFSKSLTPALRVGLLVAPEREDAGARSVLQVTSLAVSPLMTEIAARWIRDGTARSIGVALRAEAEERRALFAAVLGGPPAHRRAAGFHTWLPLPRADADRVVLRCAREGVLVTPPAVLMADPDAPESGIRVCLGAPSPAQLDRGLRLLKRALEHRDPAAPVV